MYRGLVEKTIEQTETFMEIPTRLIGWVMFSTVSSVISQVTLLLSYCIKLQITTAGAVYSGKTEFL